MTHKFKAVPVGDVMEDTRNHAIILRQLKEGYETLSRQRGTKGTWIVTLEDLIHFGLITEKDADAWANHIGRSV